MKSAGMPSLLNSIQPLVRVTRTEVRISEIRRGRSLTKQPLNHVAHTRPGQNSLDFVRFNEDFAPPNIKTSRQQLLDINKYEDQEIHMNRPTGYTNDLVLSRGDSDSYCGPKEVNVCLGSESPTNFVRGE